MIASSHKWATVLCYLLVVFLIYSHHDNITGSYQKIRAGKWSSSSNKTAHQPENDEFEHGPPAIIQITMEYGNNFDLACERALRTHELNGERWGYPIHILRQDLIGGAGDFGLGVYNKLLHLFHQMVDQMNKPKSERSEWMAWFDADTIILNNEVPWTTFLPPPELVFQDINLLVTKDFNGFNAGVFMIRICEWSVKLLGDAFAYPRLKPKVRLDFNEQTALQKVFDEPERIENRLYVPKEWFNTYGVNWEPGVMLVHFPGMFSARVPAMSKFLNKVERNPKEYQMPLWLTPYPNSTAEYWSVLQNAKEKLKQLSDYRQELASDDYFEGKDGSDKHAPTKDQLAKAEKELIDAVQNEAHELNKVRDKTENLDQIIQTIEPNALEFHDHREKMKHEEEDRKHQEMEKHMLEELQKKKEEHEKAEKEKSDKEDAEKEEKAKKAAAEKSRLNWQQKGDQNKSDEHSGE